jgi:hypothetical protein
MANLINVNVIYNGTTGIFVGDESPRPTISVNCERINAWSPRPVWLKRQAAPGDGTVLLYEPTFNPTSDELLDENILQGFWIEQDGQDVMIDAVSVAAFQEACTACCGDVPTIVTPFYASGIPAYTPNTLKSICIYRFDDGSAKAHNAFAWDYTGLYVGKVQLRSNFSGVSHYTLQTYFSHLTFPVKGTDVIYQGACSS